MYQDTEIGTLILLSCWDRGENDVPDHHPGEIGREKLQFHPLIFTQKIVIMALLSLFSWTELALVEANA